MGQQFRVLVALVENWVQFQHPHGGSQPAIDPVPGIRSLLLTSMGTSDRQA